MEFKYVVNKIMEDNELEFMSETGKVLSVNYNKKLIVTSEGKTVYVTTNYDFEDEKWGELLTNKKTFNELLELHTSFNSIIFQVRHDGQEEDDFEARLKKYCLNEFLADITENFSSSEVALILKDVEIFTE